MVLVVAVLREEGGEEMQRRGRGSRVRERERVGVLISGLRPESLPPPFVSFFFWLNNIIQLIPGLVLVSGLAKLGLKRPMTNISVQTLEID